MQSNPFEEIAERLSRIEDCLIEIKGNTGSSKSQSEVDELLTIKQVSELLKLSVPTIYGYVHRAEIPFSKPAKRLYFSKCEVTEWVKSKRSLTISEAGKKAEELLARKKK